MGKMIKAIKRVVSKGDIGCYVKSGPKNLCFKGI